MNTGSWLPGLIIVDELHLLESPETPPLVEETSNDTDEGSFISSTIGMSFKLSS